VIDPLAVDEEWWGTLRFRSEEIVGIWPAAILVAKPGPKKGHATGKAGICEMADRLLRDGKVPIGRGTTTRLAQIIHTEPIGCTLLVASDKAFGEHAQAGSTEVRGPFRRNRRNRMGSTCALIKRKSNRSAECDADSQFN
jgi:hypothetical protein